MFTKSCSIFGIVAGKTQNKYIPALRYDWLTALYDPLVQITMREKTFKHRLVDQANIQPHHRVLDLGYGTGTLTLLTKAHQSGAEIVGIDADAKVLSIVDEPCAIHFSQDSRNICERNPFIQKSIYQRSSQMFFKTFVTFFVLLMSSCPAFAHNPDEDNKTEIQQVIRGVAKAWQDGDADGFRKYFASDKGIRMIEGGTQNVGVDDLIEHHVLPHHDEFAELAIEIKATEIHFMNGYDNAWAISDFDVRIKAKDGKKTKATGYETFVLQKFNGKWKIVHSHSSTRRVKD